MSEKPKLLIFASGSNTIGFKGTTAANLLCHIRNGYIDADVVGVVSHHSEGSVKDIARKYKAPFFYLAEGKYYKGKEGKKAYDEIIIETGAEFFALMGYFKRAYLPAQTTWSFHGGYIEDTANTYDEGIRARTLELFEKGAVISTAISGLFVTDTGKYDDGPIFFEKEVAIYKEDNLNTLNNRVKKAEYKWQPKIVKLILEGKISWDGKDPNSLRVPEGYEFLPRSRKER